MTPYDEHAAGTEPGGPAAGALPCRSRIGLGTAALALPYGPPGAEVPPPPTSEAVRTIRAALDLGIDAIDTAPAYGRAEQLVGEAIRGRQCFVATKLSIPPGGWGAVSPPETAALVEASALASLRRLRRERLDLLQIHNADSDLVKGAIPAALVSLRERGTTALTGATVYGEEVALAAIESGAFDVVQIAYSALDRRPEHRVFAAAERHGVALVARSVLLRGVLSPAARNLAGAFAPLRDAADDLRRALGVGWMELPAAALAWVVSRPEIALALIGPRDQAELRSLIEGAARFDELPRAVPTPMLTAELIDPRLWAEEPLDPPRARQLGARRSR